MQQMPVTIHTGSYCKRLWNVDFDPRTMICSTNWENRHVGCDVGDMEIRVLHSIKCCCEFQSDSGGPVACSFGNRIFLMGIVSYGIHEQACRRMSRPSVSTKVSRFLPWIEQQRLILDKRWFNPICIVVSYVSLINTIKRAIFNFMLYHEEPFVLQVWILSKTLDVQQNFERSPKK